MNLVKFTQKFYILCVTLAREESPPISVRRRTPLVQNVSRVFGDNLQEKYAVPLRGTILNI